MATGTSISSYFEAQILNWLKGTSIAASPGKPGSSKNGTLSFKNWMLFSISYGPTNPTRHYSSPEVRSPDNSS